MPESDDDGGDDAEFQAMEERNDQRREQWQAECASALALHVEHTKPASLIADMLEAALATGTQGFRSAVHMASALNVLGLEVYDEEIPNG